MSAYDKLVIVYCCSFYLLNNIDLRRKIYNRPVDIKHDTREVLT